MSKCDFNKRASQLYAEITFRHLQEEICCIFSEHLLLRTAASESKLIGLFYQYSNSSGWLMEIDIFNVMVSERLVCWMRLVD